MSYGSVVVRAVWLFAAALAQACGDGSAPSAAAAERNDRREVRLVGVTEARLDRTVMVNGDLAAEEQSVLSMRVPGTLEALDVDLGSTVSAGQPIARLEAAEYRLRVAQAEAALRQARARLGLPDDGDHDTVDPESVGIVRQTRAVLEEARITLSRVRTFVDRGLSPRADLDAAVAAFEVAESRYLEALEEVRSRQAILAQRNFELELAREQLSASVLLAPFAGQILARPAAPGQYVAAGTPIVTLVRLHPLRLRVELPERSAHRVKVGQAVRVAVEGVDGVHTGVVARLSPAISSDNRTLLAEAELPNDPPTLRPGSFARAEFVVESGTPALMVPADTVVSFAGVDKVFMVEDGHTVERRVRLGRREGGLIEVEEGLAPGDRVVARPGAMTAGEPVRVSGDW